MTPKGAQGIIAFLDDLVRSGKADCAKIEVGPFFEPLTDEERAKLDGFNADALALGYPAVETRDPVLGVVHCVAFVPSRQVAS